MVQIVHLLVFTSRVSFLAMQPNTLKTAGVFDAQLVMQQLRYSGVLEVVRIRREGFPSRASFMDFYKKYHLLAHGRGWPSPAECSLEQAKDFSLQLIRGKLQTAADSY